MNGCDLCGDFPAQLRAACHPTAPLRVELVSPTELVLRCYVPTCNREVKRLHIMPSGLEGTRALVLYFGTDTDRDEFVALIHEAKPNMRSVKL